MQIISCLPGYFESSTALGSGAIPLGSGIIPMVVRTTPGGERTMDMFSFLLEQGIIDITGPISDDTAKLVTAQLQYLKHKDADDIRLYLNSPGGSVTAGMAIYDCIKTLGCPVSVICRGLAASMGSVLLAAGTKGRRVASENSRIMIHQPLIAGGGFSGKATDVAISSDQLNATRKQLARVLARETGHDVRTIERDFKDDNWMTADEALAYGIIDEIIRNPVEKVARRPAASRKGKVATKPRAKRASK